MPPTYQLLESFQTAAGISILSTTSYWLSMCSRKCNVWKIHLIESKDYFYNNLIENVALKMVVGLFAGCSR